MGDRGLASRFTQTYHQPGFFEAAIVRFSEYSQNMQFKVLNIEENPISQGFEAARYDVVLVSVVAKFRS